LIENKGTQISRRTAFALRAIFGRVYYLGLAKVN